MDRLIIERKLDSLQRCLARIRSRRPRMSKAWRKISTGRTY